MAKKKELKVNSAPKFIRYGINIFCRLVKGIGIALLLLLLVIFIGEGPPNPFKLTARELSFMAVLLTILFGLALAVWQQLIGGIVVLAGIAAFTLIFGVQDKWLIFAFLLTGVLNIICWRLRSKCERIEQ